MYSVIGTPSPYNYVYEGMVRRARRVERYPIDIGRTDAERLFLCRRVGDLEIPLLIGRPPVIGFDLVESSADTPRLGPWSLS